MEQGEYAPSSLHGRVSTRGCLQPVSFCGPPVMTCRILSFLAKLPKMAFFVPANSLNPFTVRRKFNILTVEKMIRPYYESLLRQSVAGTVVREGRPPSGWRIRAGQCNGRFGDVVASSCRMPGTGREVTMFCGTGAQLQHDTQSRPISS